MWGKYHIQGYGERNLPIVPDIRATILLDLVTNVKLAKASHSSDIMLDTLRIFANMNAEAEALEWLKAG